MIEKNVTESINVTRKVLRDNQVTIFASGRVAGTIDYYDGQELVREVELDFNLTASQLASLKASILSQL